MDAFGNADRNETVGMRNQGKKEHHRTSPEKLREESIGLMLKPEMITKKNIETEKNR